MDEKLGMGMKWSKQELLVANRELQIPTDEKWIFGRKWENVGIIWRQWMQTGNYRLIWMKLGMRDEMGDIGYEQMQTGIEAVMGIMGVTVCRGAYKGHL